MSKHLDKLVTWKRITEYQILNIMGTVFNNENNAQCWFCKNSIATNDIVQDIKIVWSYNSETEYIKRCFNCKSE